MDRVRFEELLAAYGADFQRWPEDVRAASAAFAATGEAADALRDARAVDAMLAQAPTDVEGAPELLVRRILKQAPRPQASGLDRRAMLALAACAMLGVLIGYGGALFAPAPDTDDGYFTAAFAAPSDVSSGDEG